MKIAHIATGVLEIPPKSWGAIEKIIWNLKLVFEKNGHEVIITHTEDPRLKENYFDIVNVYIENQANDLASKNIKYFFWMCDHHAFIYGKNSHVYKNNCKAIDNSILTFFPAEYLVSYFDFKKNTLFLPLGVDVNKYKRNAYANINKSLICVANNGIIGNIGEDRKGFIPAINSAISLNLPITICGPTHSNKGFFELHPQTYNKLTLKYDLNEDELIKEMSNHSIFLHPSSIETGHPNMTMLEALSLGLPVIGTYWGKHIPGVIKSTRDESELCDKIKSISNNLNFYSSEARKSAINYSWDKVYSKLFVIYNSYILNNFNIAINLLNSKEIYTNRLEYIYDTPYKLQVKSISNLDIQTVPDFFINFCDGAFIQVSNILKNIKVNFYDVNEKIYSTTLNNNCWAKVPRKWATKYKIEVLDNDDNLIFIHNYDCTGKRVFIGFESRSLGDTIAWIPYVEQFRVNNNCEVLVSTFHNSLFKNVYKNLIFIEPGNVIENLYASYKLGIFNPTDRAIHKNDTRLIPLQKIASDMLGLEYKEIKPLLYFEDSFVKNNEEKIVCIGPQSTAAAKFWQHQGGWQAIIDYLNNIGYKIYCISENDNELKNVIKIINKPLEYVISIINKCDFFIGLGSGLSWVAWALNKKVILISGFSKSWCEFKTPYRIINDNVCNGCFNDINFEFDRGNWNWCPRNQNFICTQSITPDIVINTIDRLLNDIANGI